MPFLLHTIFLSLALLLTYLWTKNPSLSPFTLQLVGLTILSYFGLKMIFSKAGKLLNALDAIVLTSLTFLLVISTGSLKSPLFFILYFLLFGLALLFEPVQAFLVSLLLTAFLLLNHTGSLDTSSLVNLATLFLVSPIAVTLGHKYLETLEKTGRIKILDQKLAKEETDTLIWLTTRAKPTLTSLIDTTSEIIVSNALPFRLKEKLTALHQDLITLNSSAKELEKEVKDTAEKI